MKYLSFFLIIVSLVSPSSAVTCWTPDGYYWEGLEWRNCNPDQNSVGMCCRPSQICLPNGLCKEKDGGEYSRQTCLSKNWSATGCLDECAGLQDGKKYPGYVVTPCDGGDNSTWWCCGADCCGIGDFQISENLYEREEPTFSLPYFTDTESQTESQTEISLTELTQGAPTPAESTQIESTQTEPTQTESTQTESPQTETSEPESSSGLSTGEKAGVGVGVAVGAIAIIGFLGFFLRRQRKRKVPDGTAPRVELTSPN